ncbi:FAD-binding protein, partial [bacterium]|nr:FAD-binding protein [bacterium]
MKIRAWHVDERKFWGWGDPKVLFDHENRPKMWPTFSEELGKPEFHPVAVIEESNVQIDEPQLNDGFMACMYEVLEDIQIAIDKPTRIRHSYGQSYRDLLRLRKGQIDASPDAVLYPKSHFEVCEILKAAKQHNVCIIPYGGGSNILRMVER